MDDLNGILNASFFGENFKWSTRAYNVLRWIEEDLGTSQVGSLVLLTPKRILQYKNAGQKTVGEIESELSRFGLSLTSSMRIELNEHTRAILGRPNFACMRIAHQLRKMGHEIPNKAEEEQATVLWWMLNLYLKYGDKWQEEGERILKSDSGKISDNTK
jgi:hypothetical protein